MGDAVREGDRVVVRGMGGRLLFAGEVDRLDGTVAYVLPDGKAKPLPAPLERLRLEERRPPPAAALTRAPDTSTPAPAPRQPRSKPDRDAPYLQWVRMHPCCYCGTREGVEAHHWRKGRALASKVSDYFTVPLCEEHHREFHDRGQIGSMSPADTRERFRDAQIGMLARAVRVLRRRGGLDS